MWTRDNLKTVMLEFEGRQATRRVQGSYYKLRIPKYLLPEYGLADRPGKDDSPIDQSIIILFDPSPDWREAIIEGGEIVPLWVGREESGAA